MIWIWFDHDRFRYLNDQNFAALFIIVSLNGILNYRAVCVYVRQSRMLGIYYEHLVNLCIVSKEPSGNHNNYLAIIKLVNQWKLSPIKSQRFSLSLSIIKCALSIDLNHSNPLPTTLCSSTACKLLRLFQTKQALAKLRLIPNTYKLIQYFRLISNFFIGCNTLHEEYIGWIQWSRYCEFCSQFVYFVLFKLIKSPLFLLADASIASSSLALWIFLLKYRISLTTL